VQLVDEQDDLLVLRDLVHHRLEALLELAAVLRAGDDGRHVEREHAVVAERLGHSPLAMSCASPSTMAVLPTPGSPMRTGLFFFRRVSTIPERGFLSRRFEGSSDCAELLEDRGSSDERGVMDIMSAMAPFLAGGC
jgi:hypothetical protein